MADLQVSRAARPVRVAYGSTFSAVTSRFPSSTQAPPADDVAAGRALFEDVMAAYGETQMRQAEANMAMSRAMTGYANRNVWRPAHAWLLRHKLVNDAVGVAVDVAGVAADVAGVVAGVVFIGDAVFALRRPY